jgi:TDG/mug DNA glycosylase family protein
VKHATPRALDLLEPLLAEIRRCEQLAERRRGVFYLRSRAFLHFHEDPAGLFADLRAGADFERMRVGTRAERRAFLRALRRSLADPARARKGKQPASAQRTRPVLEDLLAKNLALVVCGSAAGTTSARLGQYYAGRGNKFWRTLHATGLTPRLLAPAEYRELLSFGIGLTDVVKDQSGSDADIDFTRSDPDALRAKIRRHAPRWLAFNSKRAARTYLGRSAVDYGPQPETIGATRLFVAPSTGGAAGGSWDVSVWHALAQRVKAEP